MGFWNFLLCFSLLCHSACGLASSTRRSKIMGFAEQSSTNIIEESNIQQRQLPSVNREVESTSSAQLSRRSAIASATMLMSAVFATNSPVQAADDVVVGLDTYLYKIIRVKEATQQEKRLIQTGKFKDIQRANVKL
jgi:ABC-type thiamine transport system substrate-binding protein